MTKYAATADSFQYNIAFPFHFIFGEDIFCLGRPKLQHVCSIYRAKTGSNPGSRPSCSTRVVALHRLPQKVTPYFVAYFAKVMNQIPDNKLIVEQVNNISEEGILIAYSNMPNYGNNGYNNNMRYASNSNYSQMNRNNNYGSYGKDFNCNGKRYQMMYGNGSNNYGNGNNMQYGNSNYY